MRNFFGKSQPYKPLPDYKILNRDAFIRVYSYLFSSKSFSKKIIVTPYHWPDLDGIASAFALSQLLQTQGFLFAKSMIWKTPQQEAQWVMNKFDLLIPQIDPTYAEEYILVDVSARKDIPDFIPSDKVNVIIDHRQYYDLQPFPNALAWIVPVGSVTTLVAQLSFEANIRPTILAARLMYLAIMSNTVKCKARNTTAQDKIMANWLQEVGDIDEKTVDEMFIAKSNFEDIRQKLDHDLSSTLQLINGKQTAVAQLEMVNVSDFFDANKNEILNSLKILKADRKAESLFLVAIDIKNFKTFFCFLQEEDIGFFNQKIAMQPHHYYFMAEEVLARKEIIATLQDCGNQNKPALTV